MYELSAVIFSIRGDPHHAQSKVGFEVINCTGTVILEKYRKF